MSNFKFAVGDKVVVLIDGFQCPRYSQFFEENGKPELAEKFVEYKDVPVNVIGTVVLTGIGTGTKDNTYAIEIGENVYIICEQGVFGALEEVSKEELEALEKEGLENAKKRFIEDMTNTNPLLAILVEMLFDDLEDGK